MQKNTREEWVATTHNSKKIMLHQLALLKIINSSLMLVALLKILQFKTLKWKPHKNKLRTHLWILLDKEIDLVVLLKSTIAKKIINYKIKKMFKELTKVRWLKANKASHHLVLIRSKNLVVLKMIKIIRNRRSKVKIKDSRHLAQQRQAFKLRM